MRLLRLIDIVELAWLAYLVSAQEITTLDNIDYKSAVDFECDPGNVINRVRSYSGGDDRKWSFGCTEAPAGALTENCDWSQITSLTDEWNLDCDSSINFDEDSSDSGNSIITGIGSYYDEDTKDRRWKIKCCESIIQLVEKRSRKLNYNGESDYADGKYKDDGEYFDFTVPNGYLMTGLAAGKLSADPAKNDDRAITMTYKSIKNCVVDHVEILDSPEPTMSESAVVAIGTVIGCSEDVLFGLSLAQDTAVTESRALTVAKDNTVTWGASVGVSAGVGFKLFGLGSSLTFTREVSYDGSITFGEENSKSITTSSSSGASQLIKAYGPKAFLVYATMDKWTFAAENVTARYTGTCSYYNGGSEPWKIEQWSDYKQISIEGKSFANTQFFILSASLAASQCNQALSDCIQGVEAKDVLKVEATNATNTGLTANDLEKDFKACLNNTVDGHTITVMRK